MARTRISLIGERYDCVGALFDGRIVAEGIELEVTHAASPQAMRRQLREWAFDVCEMAFGAYLIARARGADVCALPFFPRRAFFHTQFVVRAQAGVVRPADLHGKRVGVAEYVQSATLWARGVLEGDFGVDARRIEWHVERAGDDSTGAVLGFRPPPDVRLAPTPTGVRVSELLEAGALDAALVGAWFQRLDTPLPAGLVPLFPDVELEGRRFLASHGYVPANHLYMIRGSLAREHADVVARLHGALLRADEEARVARRAPAGLLYGNEYLARTCDALVAAPYAHGIDANRTMLEDVVRLCVDQGLIAHPPGRIEDLFVPGVR